MDFAGGSSNKKQTNKKKPHLPADAGVMRDSVSIPGLGRSFEEGNGNPLQYSCLVNPTDRGAWPTSVYGVT